LGAISVSNEVTAAVLESEAAAGIDDVVYELKALERHTLGDQFRGEGLVLRKGLRAAIK
jgi:hypothetical protein